MHIRKHTVFPEEFPEAWASDWGEDEYGLWMAFSYKGVCQAFRWCEPGTFLMGSPEEESERYSDELQHEVTLSKGFWIADALVTQALWQVVMGKNPSRFQGDERPVENVSWDETQTFIARMNGLKAELNCVCRPKRNGNMRAEQAALRRFAGVTRLIQRWLISMATTRTTMAAKVNTGNRQPN